MVGLQQAGKGGGKLVCVEYLSVVEDDALYQRQGGADEEGNHHSYLSTANLSSASISLATSSSWEGVRASMRR